MAPRVCTLVLSCVLHGFHTNLYVDYIIGNRKNDVLTLNNTSFHSAIDDIYPEELKLKKTSESSIALSYLDIQITIVNGKYSTAVYDKRDSFNFKIVNFPHLSSNIPSGPAYIRGLYFSVSAYRQNM